MTYLMESSDFLKIKDPNTRYMIENAYQAITVTEGWDL